MSVASYSKDTTASWDATNSRFIVPVSGFYNIMAHGYFVNVGGANNGVNTILLYKNGSYLTDVSRRDSISTENQNAWSFVSGSTPPVYLVAGDILEFYAFQNSGVTRQFNGWHFSIQRISSPQTIAMGEKVKTIVASSGGTTIPHLTFTAPDMNIKILDTHNAYNQTTKRWVQPRSGSGRIYGNLSVYFPAIIGSLVCRIEKNNSFYYGNVLTIPNISNTYTINIAVGINGNAGDQWAVYLWQNTGANRQLEPNSAYNILTFELD
jgi:hypothetical protein